MLQAVPPPIIRSSKLYTQHRVFVGLFLLLTGKSSTNARCCVYSFELLMTGGGTAWNMYIIYSNKYHRVTLHLVGYAWTILTMHGPMNVKSLVYFMKIGCANCVFLFCKSNCALSHSNTGSLEQNNIPQQITQMQLPASLALPKFVITVKGKDEVDPNAMNAYGGSRGKAPLLTTELHGDEWSISRQDSFTPAGKKSGTHWTVGWVGPQSGSGRF